MHALRNASRLFFALAFLVAVGCPSSPTEPKGGGGGAQTPKPPTPTVTFIVTVTANPSQLTAGSPTPSNIGVNVVRSDTGQPPADGSGVPLTPTLGNFNSVSGPKPVDLTPAGGPPPAAPFPPAASGPAPTTPN